MTYLPFIIAGLVTGSVYGLAGTGLVLTYKTTGIFNFAEGSIGAAAAYLFYFLHVTHGVAWPIAGAISVLILGPVVGCGLAGLGKKLSNESVAFKIVAMLGIVLFVEAIALVWYGTAVPQFPQFLPQKTVDVGGVYITGAQFIIMGISLAATGGLYAMLRYTRTGMTMRAVVDNPELVDLTGTDPARISRGAWMIGTTFAALAGVLLSPSIGLDATILTLLVVQAFGSAAVGYFSNLPLTYAGGLAIGVMAALSTKLVESTTWLSGLPPALPFIVLFIALLVTPKAKLAATSALRLPRTAWRAPTRVRVVGGVLFAGLVLSIPSWAGVHQIAFTTWLIYVILFLSLGLLVKTSGQVSLCHLAFAAIGAAAFAHFIDDYHIPWLIAVVLGALVTVPVSAIIAFAAIRLSGVFLSLATYGFGILIEQLVYNTPLMFGVLVGSGLNAPTPNVPWLSTSTGYFYLVVAFVVVTVLTITAVLRSRLGRLLRALADSPIALETHGVNINTTRLAVFCISTFFAGIAGALLSADYGLASGDLFSSFTSLTLFVILMIIVGGEPWYAFLAAFNLTIIPSYLNLGNNITNYLNIMFGTSAVFGFFLFRNAPGVPLPLRRFLERVGQSPAKQSGTRVPAVAVDVPSSALAAEMAVMNEGER